MRVLGYCSIEGAFRGAAAYKTGIGDRPRKFCVRCLCRRHWRTCRPQRWGGFRQMLARRDRVRLSGFYALRQSRSKPVRRDMWTPKGVRSSLLGRGGVVALPAVLRGWESAVLLVCRARGRSAGGRAPRGEEARARDDSEAPPGRGEDAPRRLRAEAGRRRGDGRRAARPRGLGLTLTHGARGRGVGLDLDRHSQVEKGGVSFDHRVPEDQRAFAFVAVPAWA